MDFSERKCSGGGLGTKNGPVISLKMVANLILNLSVFHFVSLSLTFPGLSADGQTDRRRRTDDRQTERLSIRISPQISLTD